MRTIDLNTERVKGKVYVELGREGLRVMTDPADLKRRFILVKDKKLQVNILLSRKKETRFYSVIKQDWVAIPEKDQKWEYDFRNWSTSAQPSMLAGSTLSMFFKETFPLLSPLFDDEELRQQYIYKLVERKVKNWQEEVERSEKNLLKYKDKLKRGNQALKSKRLEELRKISEESDWS